MATVTVLGPGSRVIYLPLDGSTDEPGTVSGAGTAAGTYHIDVRQPDGRLRRLYNITCVDSGATAGQCEATDRRMVVVETSVVANSTNTGRHCAGFVGQVVGINAHVTSGTTPATGAIDGTVKKNAVLLTTPATFDATALAASGAPTAITPTATAADRVFTASDVFEHQLISDNAGATGGPVCIQLITIPAPGNVS